MNEKRKTINLWKSSNASVARSKLQKQNSKYALPKWKEKINLVVPGENQKEQAACAKEERIRKNWQMVRQRKQLTCAAATGPSGVLRMMMPPSIDANSCPGKDYLHRTTTPGVWQHYLASDSDTSDNTSKYPNEPPPPAPCVLYSWCPGATSQRK